MPIIQKKKTAVVQVAVSVRDLLMRLSVFFLIFLAVSVVFVNKMDGASKLRTTVMDIATPIISILSSPAQAYRSLKATVNDMAHVYSSNALLRNENLRLKRMDSIAVGLEAENQRLRKLLNLLPKQNETYVTARIFGKTSGAYSQSAIIPLGANNGVKNGQIVTNTDGLVGRLTDVGEHSSRILLLTDISSKIPVLTERSEERAILTGNNTSLATLKHLPENTNIMVGERLVTSGDGKYFPSGIPIGTVYSVTNKSVVIKPFMDTGRLDYVNINVRQ